MKFFSLNLSSVREFTSTIKTLLIEEPTHQWIVFIVIAERNLCRLSKSSIGVSHHDFVYPYNMTVSKVISDLMGRLKHRMDSVALTSPYNTYI